MTRNIPLYVVAAFLFKAAVCVNLVAEAKIKNTDRNLASANLLDAKILNEKFNVSIESVKEQIIDLHKNVKLCIDMEFAKDPADIMPFDNIIEMCAGTNFSIVKRFYMEITFTIKEVMKEKIKAALANGYCNNIVFMCIAYFQAIELFIKMDYDVLKALELSTEDLERKIDQDKLEHLIQVTHDQIGDYEALRQHLLDERHFLSSYFSEQKEIYQKKYANFTYVRQDNVIDDEHIPGAADDLTTRYHPDDLKVDNDVVSKLLNNEDDHGSDLMSYLRNSF